MPLQIIASGELDHHSGEKVGYTVANGWEARASMECDLEWKQGWVDLFNYIKDQNFDDETLGKVLSSLSMEDAHWDWFKKAMTLRSAEYEWFHLYAKEKPQGACVIYHPKESALTGLNIFYVE